MDLLTQYQPIEKTAGLLHRIANRIRQSLELQEILNATATEVRDYLKTDRVKVYRFNPDGNGVVIAESIEGDRLPSLLGLHFPADDIPPMARDLFLRARQRSVVDVDNHQISFVPLNTDANDSSCPTAKNNRDLRYRPIDPCHAEYLNAMGVKSSIVVPIVLEEASTGKQPTSVDPAANAQLWGLLACHHSEPRKVTEAELEFVQAVVDQVSVAIAQSHLLDQVRAQAKQEANINRVTQLLRTNTATELQLALEETVATFQGSGGRLYLLANESQPRELHTCGEQPAFIDDTQTRTVEENYLWKNFIHSSVESVAEGESDHRPWSVQWMRSAYSLGSEQLAIDRYPDLWAIADIYREPLFRTLTPFFDGTAIRSLVIIPLYYGPRAVGCLTVFRNEVDTEILWAGYHTPDTRQLMPRQSFEVWKQAKKGAGQAWTESEIKYAQALSVRFSTAVKQYRLYQQVQQLNANLEAQVTERTQQLQQRTRQLQQSHQELEQSFSRQAALVSIVSKIRESLDIEEIFRVTTRELSQVMRVDTVYIHQFGTDWGKRGASDTQCIIPFLSAQLTNAPQIDVEKADSFVQQSACLQAVQAERYQSKDALAEDVLAIDDIHQQALSQHQLDLYEQLQIKSLLSVPILVGQDLWGCIGLYQQTTRQWEPSEVEFTIQIAAQLGVALQHASLLALNRRKKEELSNTLRNLKETQAQLIQTEKMSSLGRLVAGVAHEINNPVNFIHANLSHFDEYSQNLFRVIASYQAHYPNPPESVQTLLEDIDLSYIEEDLPKLCSSLSLGTKRIREIVLSLRNFSRLDESTLKAVDLHEGIESTLLILQHRLEPNSLSPDSLKPDSLNSNGSKPKIEIQKDYGDLPLVECYPGQINQVFMNLIGNAIDELESIESSTKTKAPSSEEAPVKTISISTRLISDERVGIFIRDNGRGIQPALMDKLFDPFFTTKSVGQGTGLGLSISYKIIEAHTGRLYCESRPDEGAEFVIELPVRIED